jgi:hypothetical protein
MSDLSPFVNSSNLPVDATQVMEAEKNNKSQYPSTQNGVAFVCTRIVESGYLEEANHAMDHTSATEFKAKVDRFVELLYNAEENAISKNTVVEQRKILEKRLKNMQESLKAAIKVKHFDLFGNALKRYGFGKYYGNISWGTAQEEIVRNMKRAVETLQIEGHEGFQYTVQDYVDLYDQYSTLVKQGYISTNSSTKATKNQVRDELDELLRCVMHNVQCNFPKTWQNKAIDIGFLKVRN